MSNPGQQRRAEKIRVAQRNQSARLNAAAVLGPGMFLSSHMQAIVRLLWPGIASTNGRFSQYFRSAGTSSVPRETIDVDAVVQSPPSPPPANVLPSLVRSVAEPPQIIDLTGLDASDSDENNMSVPVVVQTIDLTQDDDEDVAAAAAATPTPHEDDPVIQVTVPLVQ